MKIKIDATVNRVIPTLTDNPSVTAQTLKAERTTLLKPDTGLINKSNHQVSKNLQTFAFAFEQLEAIGFNINAGLKGSKASANQISADRMTKYPDIYLEKVGEIIANIKAKAGSSQYFEKPVKSDLDSGIIPSNSEKLIISGATILIEIDGVKSFPVRQDFAQWVAENPYLAANIMSVAATVGEVSGVSLEGAAINTIINILSESIKTIGAYCREEQGLDQTELTEILEAILAALKTGCLRGIAIKLIQKLMDGSAFAALGFTVGIEVISTFIKALKDEITIEKAITEVEPRMLTSAVITTIVILFPTVGTALLSSSVIKAIWEEISPEWKSCFLKKDTDIGSAIATGNAVIAISEVGIIEQQIWQNLSPEKRQAVIDKMKHSTSEQVKIAYNMTLEKATEAFDITLDWFGERTSELALSVESATPTKVQTVLNETLDSHQKKVVYKVA